MQYPSYQSYKKSRLEWIDELPKEWDVTRLRLLSKRYSGGTPNKKNSEYWTDGTIPWLNSGAVNQGVITEPSKYITELGLKESSAKWIPENSIIIALAGQGKTKGTTAYTTFPTTCNQSMAVVIFDKENPKYMYWWLTSQYKNIRGMASDDARDGLNLEMIGSIPCPTPPNEEQEKIATFLDYKTQQIDQLIEKKKALIEKLNELRIAVITQAVTKGLDKNAKMKPSGLDWLGDVPAHWINGYKLVFMSESKKQTFVNGPFGSDLLTAELKDEGVPVIYSGDVKETGFNRKSSKFVTEEKAKQLDFCRIDGGDVLLAKVGDPPGDACVYPLGEPNAIVTQDVVRIKIDKEVIDPDYLCFLLNSKVGRHSVRMVSVEATRGRFSLADLKGIRFTIPPLDEQIIIAQHVKDLLNSKKRVAEKIDEAIERLEEYRTALITDAVTGIIDVRNVVLEV